MLKIFARYPLLALLTAALPGQDVPRHIEAERFRESSAVSSLRATIGSRRLGSGLRMVERSEYRGDEMVALLREIAMQDGLSDSEAIRVIEVLAERGTAPAMEALTDVILESDHRDQVRRATDLLLEAVFECPSPPFQAALDRALTSNAHGEALRGQLLGLTRSRLHQMDPLTQATDSPSAAALREFVADIRRTAKSDLPLGDILSLDRWRERWLSDIDQALGHQEHNLKVRPRLAQHIRNQTQELKKLRRQVESMKHVALGVEMLAEFYMQTQRAGAAMDLIRRSKQQALALQDLPTIRIERVEGISNGRGGAHVDNVEITDVDVGYWAKRFFSSFAQAASSDAILAKRRAERISGLLNGLTPKTLRQVQTAFVQQMGGKVEEAEESDPGSVSFATHELLENPNCSEPAGQTGAIPSWKARSGIWHQGKRRFRGTFSVNGCDVDQAELYQSVNIDAHRHLVDRSMLEIRFRGSVRSYDQEPGDTTRIVVEFRNRWGALVGAALDTGDVLSRDTWQVLEGSMVVPPGARSVRMRLITDRRRPEGKNQQINVDGHFDDLSLVLAAAHE